MTDAAEPSPPPSTRVEIAAAGHQVVVESPDPLDVVAAKALEVWKATDDPQLSRGFGTIGFTSEQVAGPLPPELTLPARMTEESLNDRRTRTRRGR